MWTLPGCSPCIIVRGQTSIQHVLRSEKWFIHRFIFIIIIMYTFHCCIICRHKETAWWNRDVEEVFAKRKVCHHAWLKSKSTLDVST